MTVYLQLPQLTAFRASRHNLSVRLPPGSLLVAAGACGVQNTPQGSVRGTALGSAALSLVARVEALTSADIDRALYEHKSILQAWSLRAAPTIFPTTDLPVFTTGLLPFDDASISAFSGGVGPALEKIGIRAVQVLDFTSASLLEALDGRALTKDALGVELAALIEPRLTPAQLAAWRLPSWYAPGQSLGESVVRFMLPVTALRGLCCHAGRRENKAFICRTDQWLGGVLPDVGANQASAQLLRRYLRCYGPSTARHFAGWAGIGQSQAEDSWNRVRDELVDVRVAGKPSWLLAADIPHLLSPPEPSGLRLLPPHDPFLQLRDRETLVPDPVLRREIWRSAGNPGVILSAGQFAGVWRPSRKGRRLALRITWGAAFQPSLRSLVQAEAQGLTAMMGCTAVEIEEM